MEHYIVVKYNDILKFLATLLNTNDYLVEKNIRKIIPFIKYYKRSLNT